MPEAKFSVTVTGDHFRLAVEGESGVIIHWDVRARPFLLRWRLFSAKRRLYRTYRKYMKIKGELDEK